MMILLILVTFHFEIYLSLFDLFDSIDLFEYNF